jgi:hypothetical protein
MRVQPLPFHGNFEEEPVETSETLQIVAPQDAFETELLSWAILPHAETVEDDQARRDYVFSYQIGEHLEHGLFRLRIAARDASRQEHATQIAAALIVTPTTLAVQPGRTTSFAPFWFISKRLHFQPVRASDPYPGAAFGHLHFGDGANLPQRRLFGMVAGASGQTR